MKQKKTQNKRKRKRRAQSTRSKTEFNGRYFPLADVG